MAKGKVLYSPYPKHPFPKAEPCSGCLEAIGEEMDPYGEKERSEIRTVALELGADVADHECEARNHSEPCGCACRLHDEKDPAPRATVRQVASPFSMTFSCPRTGADNGRRG